MTCLNARNAIFSFAFSLTRLEYSGDCVAHARAVSLHQASLASEPEETFGYHLIPAD